jgi:hypothetical protein
LARLGLRDAEDDLVKRLLVDGAVEQSASVARVDQPAPQRLGARSPRNPTDFRPQGDVNAPGRYIRVHNSDD